MKLIAPMSLAVIISVSVAATSAVASVTLAVDDNIKVTAINGQAYNSSPFQKIQRLYTLQPGKHVITARYDRLYELAGDNHDYVKSGHVTLTAELADNQNYQLVMPGQPESYRDAREYAKNPQLAIKQGNKIVASQSVSANTKNTGLLGGLGSAIGGLFGGNSFGNNSAVEANSQAIAAIDSQPASNSINMVSTQQMSANPANISTLDQFMQLWLQATPDEREKIRQWVSP